MCVLVCALRNTSYLRYGQAQCNAPQYKQVTVNPINQFVYAAVGVNVVSGLNVLDFLQTLSTHGVDNQELHTKTQTGRQIGIQCKEIKNITQQNIYIYI